MSLIEPNMVRATMCMVQGDITGQLHQGVDPEPLARAAEEKSARHAPLESPVLDAVKRAVPCEWITQEVKL